MRRFAAVLLVALAACTHTPTGKVSIPTLPARDFDAKLASFKGKPLVVNFWATWCDPCKAEMPRLAAAAKRYEGRVRFFGIDVQDDSAIAAKFATENGVTYENVADPKRAITQEEGLLGLPVTQFYDANGKRLAVHRGEIKAAELDSEIRKLLRAG